MNKKLLKKCDVIVKNQDALIIKINCSKQRIIESQKKYANLIRLTLLHKEQAQKPNKDEMTIEL